MERFTCQEDKVSVGGALAERACSVWTLTAGTPATAGLRLQVLPEQGFKSCASLKKLGEKCGVKKLESACNEVFNYTSAPSLRLISTILKSGSLNSKQAESKNIGKQEGNFDSEKYSNAYVITRGAAYYSNLRKDGESK